MTFGGTGAIGSQIGDLQQSDAECLVGHAVAAILYIKRKLTAATPKVSGAARYWHPTICAGMTRCSV
jgi:hypothetical protein